MDILIQGIYSCHKISMHELDTMTPLSLIVPWHLTYKCSWVLMGALECSLVFLSDTECSSSWFIDKWKMLIFKINSYYWFLKWIPIRPIYWSRFHKIITNWIVLKSTWKVQLKNVKDGISRCFGGQEINKTKVETILWDTL